MVWDRHAFTSVFDQQTLEQQQQDSVVVSLRLGPLEDLILSPSTSAGIDHVRRDKVKEVEHFFHSYNQY